MSSLAQALVTYEEFLRLPDPENGHHYELHDGEIVLVPPPKPRHKLLQAQISDLLRSVVSPHDLSVQTEWPYKPAPQYQFWVADIAVISGTLMREMAGWADYLCSAPDLIVEVLSPSNTAAKVNKQRLASMSHGTRAFWVVDADQQLITVSTLSGVRQYRTGERIDVLQLLAFDPQAHSDVDVSAVFRSIA